MEETYTYSAAPLSHQVKGLGSFSNHAIEFDKRQGISIGSASASSTTESLERVELFHDDEQGRTPVCQATVPYHRGRISWKNASLPEPNAAHGSSLPSLTVASATLQLGPGAHGFLQLGGYHWRHGACTVRVQRTLTREK